MISKRLEMSFQNISGNKVTISVQDPKDDLVEDDVRAVMQTIMDRNIFTTSGGDLVRIAGARIVTTDVTDLIES